MDKKSYTIILDDDTTISGLKTDGESFISAVPISESIFNDNLSTVTVNDGERTKTYGPMTLVQITKMDDGYYLILRELTKDELWRMKMESKFDYLAMMTEIDI